MDHTVLDHKADQFDLVIAVKEAEEMRDNKYHLIAPNGQLTGILGKYEGDWEYHNVKESEGDRIHLEIPEKVAEGFIEKVDVVEPQ